MTISVNGERRHDVRSDQSIDALLETLGLPRRDIAVAVDGRVVPRSEWVTSRVPDGASVEVVTAMQGG